MSTLDLFKLDGKTAIVTGGGRGLGRVMAEGLADAGASVVLCSRKVEACRQVQREIEENGGQALALGCDLTDEEDVRRVVAAAEERFGGIDILVNNSGVTWGAPPEEMPVERFARVVDVNVTGTFAMTQVVGRSMIARGRGGSIINIASIAGLVGSAAEHIKIAGYAASKGALLALTRELAVSWARHAITVNAIAPGWFPTDMSRGVLDHAPEEMLSHVPLDRFGAPEDIKGVAVFLASRAGAYMTGQVVVVDGGWTAW